MKYVDITFKRSAKMYLGFKNTLHDGGFNPNTRLDFPLVARRAQGHRAKLGFCTAFDVKLCKTRHRGTSIHFVRVTQL